MFAVVWHFWIGLVLAVASLLVVLAVIAGYFIKVENPRYPKQP